MAAAQSFEEAPLGIVMRFDAGLAVGDEVEVRWTNSHRSYAGRGTVEKLNRASVRVELTRPVGIRADRANPDAPPVYPAGQVISVPRCTFGSIQRWSWSNGVFPVGS